MSGPTRFIQLPTAVTHIPNPTSPVITHKTVVTTLGRPAGALSLGLHSGKLPSNWLPPGGYHRGGTRYPGGGGTVSTDPPPGTQYQNHNPGVVGSSGGNTGNQGNNGGTVDPTLQALEDLFGGGGLAPSQAVVGLPVQQNAAPTGGGMSPLLIGIIASAVVALGGTWLYKHGKLKWLGLGKGKK